MMIGIFDKLFCIFNAQTRSLLRKEFAQIRRNSGNLLIAFLMPVLLTFLMTNSVSFETKNNRIGIVKECEDSEALVDLMEHFAGSEYIEIVKVSNSRKDIQSMMDENKLIAIAVIPMDFNKKISRNSVANIEIITDATEPNSAVMVGGYLEAIFNKWVAKYNKRHLQKPKSGIRIESRFWFNEALKINYMISTSILATVMTVTGTLLTALVVSKEWETGTMEATMGTPVTSNNIIISKFVPYFLLNLGSFLISFLMIIVLFGTPFKGSFVLFFIVNMLYASVVVSTGLFISFSSRSQFVASQMALLMSFLPSFLLSGLIYEISGMPKVIQLITTIVPAKYLVNISRTMFMIGNDMSIICKNVVGILFIQALLIFAIKRKFKKKI